MTSETQTKQKHLNSVAPNSAWIQLAIAVSFEIAGAIGLRMSKGFTLALPTVAALASFALALYLVSRVMKSLPVSIAYPIWAGGGTVGVALLGILLFEESFSMQKIVGIALVTFGVVIINRVSDKKSGC